MTLGERIKAHRQQARLSQEKLAERMGVSRQAVAKWESGQSAPTTENLFRLAELFRITVDELATGTGEGERSSLAEQVHCLYRAEEEKRAAQRREKWKKRIRMTLAVAGGWLVLFLMWVVLFLVNVLYSVL